ncbi:unnamed protein product [Rotaria sp. Silwood1]|nr:unnamed protein product [Rotaria sp. Silwood1]CAF3946751.1 unnamed protein product [Rotaria sp. Silwood1]CAF4995189.1 unnamed protein product [Rotaria sp. Silwood1]CAF5013529.1 unnamed protein product [Rotaria sp. Silwood1]CAF5041774.1 unnamed protein product [Rotaria sp. Silwood1]
MVNGYLIISNKAVPNTQERVNYGLGDTILIVDTKNGFYQADTTIGILMPITRIAYIYVAPGVYSFNVGARVESGRGRVYDSTVTYELMQSEDADEASLGDFPLVTTFSR